MGIPNLDEYINIYNNYCVILFTRTDAPGITNSNSVSVSALVRSKILMIEMPVSVVQAQSGN